MNAGNIRTFLSCLLFSFFITNLHAQLELKLQLMPDGESYGVYVLANTPVSPSANTITASGQVTVVAPLDFQWNSVVSHAGYWVANAEVIGPVDNPDAKYISFGLQDDQPQIIYSNTEERLLFSFKNGGDCPAYLRLIDCGLPNESDPFCFPNSMQTNPGNDLAVFDFASGASNIYYFTNVYAEYAWDCHDADGDGIVNAHEDTNGNGVFDEDIDASDLFDPNDPSGDGGLRLALKLMPDGQSWGVFAKPSGGVVPTANTITHEGRTEIVAPLGFEIDSVVSHAGTWIQDTYVNGPLENLSRSYLGFTLVADNPPIKYFAGEETLLFTFHKSGECPDSLNIIDEETDPVVLACVPTQADLCIFNKLNVTDEGTTPFNEYFYVDNYATSAWSCQDNDGDGIVNAFEDQNGDGVFTPGTGETDLNDPCDPFHPVSAALSYNGETVTCAGSILTNVTLSVDIDGPASSGYTVIYTDGTTNYTVTNYQTDDLIPVDAFGGANYRLTSVSDANGCAVYPAGLSGEFTVDEEGPLSFISQPTDITACAGAFASLSAEAVNAGAGDLTYQWEISCDDGNSWEPVDDGGGTAFLGSTTSQLSITILSPSISGCQFRLSAKTAHCGTIYSGSAKVETEGPLAINQPPADVTSCGDDQVCFTVEALNAGAGTVAYQWQARMPNTNDWIDLADNGIVSGAATAEVCLNEPNNFNDLSIRAVISTGTCPEIASEPATLQADGPLTIQSIPFDLQVESFEDAVFNANIFNQGPGDVQFQWQQSDDGTNWADVADGDFGTNTISGANTPSLVISPAAGYDGLQFRLLAGTAICGQLFTPPAKLTVNGQQLSIIKDLPGEAVETCGDELVILVFEYANLEGVLAGLTWERSYDGQNWSPVQNGGGFNIGHQPNVSGTGFYAILAINATFPLNGSQYRCRLVASSGQSLNSNTTELRVLGPLDIEVQPEDAAVCFNEAHTFSATVSNPNDLTFNQYWMMSTDGGSSWQAIPDNSPTGFGGVFENTGTSDLTITSVEGLDGRYFRLVVENDVCAAISEPVALSVEDAPHCYPASNFVDYKLKLRPDGQSWGVWIKAVGDFAPTGYNIATSGRIIIAATAGFAYYDVKSHAGGNWKPGKYKLNAPETPGISYYTFDLEPNQSVLNVQADNEIMLFSFRRTGACPDDIYLAHEFVPAGLLPNAFSGIELGSSPNQAFFLGDVYGENEADCTGQNLIANPGSGLNNNPSGNEGLTAGSMILFPNPTSDWLEIRLPELEAEGILTHKILSASGAVVQTFPGRAGGQKVSLGDLPKGLYLLTYELNGKTIEGQKFIKN